MGNGSLLEGMGRVSMFLPPVSVAGADAAKAGSKVKTAEAPATSASSCRRVYPSVWLMEWPSTDELDSGFDPVDCIPQPRAVNVAH
jgi:hypothetical protein